MHNVQIRIEVSLHQYSLEEALEQVAITFLYIVTS